MGYYFLEGIRKLAMSGGRVPNIPGVNTLGRIGKMAKIPSLKWPSIPKIKGIKLPRYGASSNRTKDTAIETLRRTLSG